MAVRSTRRREVNSSRQARAFEWLGAVDRLSKLNLFKMMARVATCGTQENESDGNHLPLATHPASPA